ncbi:MAG: hypothetical protein ACRCTW_03495 [Lactococcus garvieae]
MKENRSRDIRDVTRGTRTRKRVAENATGDSQSKQAIYWIEIEIKYTKMKGNYTLFKNT